jgi:hypothetical protein
MKRFLYRAPRVLGVLFALFISLFALDVFGEGHSIWQTILALLIHLVPVYILVIVLVIAWKWEWVGAVAFAALAVLYVVAAWGSFHWSAYAAISGPLVVLSALFLVGWIHRKQIRSR